MSQTIHVTHHSYGWAVEIGPDADDYIIHQTEAEAISSAKSELGSKGGGEIYIHSEEGEVLYTLVV